MTSAFSPMIGSSIAGNTRSGCDLATNTASINVPGMNVKAAINWEGQLSNVTTFPIELGKGWARMVRRFYKESRLFQETMSFGIIARSECSNAWTYPRSLPNPREKLAELIRYYQDELEFGQEIKATLNFCEKLWRAGKSDLAISVCEQLIQENGSGLARLPSIGQPAGRTEPDSTGAALLGKGPPFRQC